MKHIPLPVDWWLLEVVRPALDRIQLGGMVEDALVLGTAIAESELIWNRQRGGGPAWSPYQIEPATERWLLSDWTKRHPNLYAAVTNLNEREPQAIGELFWYSTALCRLRYRAHPSPLPPLVPSRLAEYHKAIYNTTLGKADPKVTVEHFGEAAWAVIQNPRDDHK